MTANLDHLLSIMARLRDPRGGCPWDLEQDFSTIAPHTVEEAYEVADAIERDDMDDLRDELGDLLFQVVFHARMAEEKNSFTFNDVAGAIVAKMIRRHPHIFGDASIETADAQTRAWEDAKAAERAKKALARGERPSALDGVTATLPAMTRAAKLQKRAARVGFDWPDPAQVTAKIEEELAEVRAEIAADSPDSARVTDEVGDLLFAVVNLARKLGVDPDVALKGTNAKFERRFRAVEQGLDAQGKTADEADLDEMEALWVRAKHAEAAE